jgi:methyl-accepting chemotaxis protein
MKRRSTLERQMLSYFGLIAAASLLITLEFIWAIHVAMSEVHSIVEASAGQGSEQALIVVLTSLRTKAFLMFVVQAVVTLIVLIMLIRRITGPLRLMVQHARAISEGDLSRTIEVRRRDELGLLGETINGLTSNIQEIVAYSLSTVVSLRDSLDDLRRSSQQCPEIQVSIDEIAVNLAGFADLLEEFKLFPDPLAGSKGEDAP